jgi:hypothetical protein
MAKIDELKARLGKEAEELYDLAAKEDDEACKEAKFKGDVDIINMMFMRFHDVEQKTEELKMVMLEHSGTDANPARAMSDWTKIHALVDGIKSSYDSLIRFLKKLDQIELTKEHLTRVLEVQAKRAERMLPHFQKFEKLLKEIGTGHSKLK